MIYDDDELEDYDDLDDMEQEDTICPDCGGTGCHPWKNSSCRTCGGSGHIEARNSFDSRYKITRYRATSAVL